MIYVGSNDGYLYALDSTGNMPHVNATIFLYTISSVTRIDEVALSDGKLGILFTCHRDRWLNLRGIRELLLICHIVIR